MPSGETFTLIQTRTILGRSEAGERTRTLFAALVLESIWLVYSADATKQAAIAKSLNLTFDAKTGMRSLMAAWLPLARKLFTMIVHRIPAPNYRESKLLSSINPGIGVIGEISKLIDAHGRLIGMTRLFRGQLSVGQSVYVLQAKYDRARRHPGHGLKYPSMPCTS